MSFKTHWQLFPTSGLGDNTYLLRSGDEALLIDPQRDAWRFLTEIDRYNLKLRYVVETHLHNDYVSGAMEVHSKTGAEIVAPAKGNYRFSYLGVADGDEIHIGSARLMS